MNLQKNFFHTAIKGAFYCFVIDLLIFFDKQTPALSVDKVVKLLDLSSSDEEKIEGIRKSQEDNISKLKNIRDKDIAHFDIKVDRSKTNTIIYQETEDLFKAVQDIFNILSLNIDRSLWIWDHIENEVKREMEWLFKNLKAGEIKRIEDINEKWK